MVYTIYHNYTDDELLRYVLDNIDHPAVVEISRRVRALPVDLEDVPDQIAEVGELEEVIQNSEKTKSDLQDEIDDLGRELDEYVRKVERLEEHIAELEATVTN